MSWACGQPRCADSPAAEATGLCGDRRLLQPGQGLQVPTPSPGVTWAWKPGDSMQGAWGGQIGAALKMKQREPRDVGPAPRRASWGRTFGLVFQTGPDPHSYPGALHTQTLTREASHRGGRQMAAFHVVVLVGKSLGFGKDPRARCLKSVHWFEKCSQGLFKEACLLRLRTERPQ